MANEQRFACTACGKCCYGRVSLTLADAFANAGRFPLAMVWTPVRQASRSFDLTARLGMTVKLPNKKVVAVQIAPTAYIPPAFSCPALTADNLCSIHAEKPLRCRTMPFYPYREESDQIDMLVPRKGWICDTTATAPIVYRNKQIIDRSAFDVERNELLKDAAALRSYSETFIKFDKSIITHITRASLNPTAGHVVVNFSSFVRISRHIDMTTFAKLQHPVLTLFERRVVGDAALNEYCRYYHEAAMELEWFAKRVGGGHNEPAK
ncbi:MAG: YkgJ family cysteine cluster protein [Rhodospirillaceae bacterium]